MEQRDRRLPSSLLKQKVSKTFLSGSPHTIEEAVCLLNPGEDTSQTEKELRFTHAHICISSTVVSTKLWLHLHTLEDFYTIPLILKFHVHVRPTHNLCLLMSKKRKTSPVWCSISHTIKVKQCTIIAMYAPPEKSIEPQDLNKLSRLSTSILALGNLNAKLPA
ncbi:hypothetical protein PR048_010872 [Dryococelus australis]|uniref:Uncharacterized protein n=1 Tax=Dryococelus australis TaxID=614101 RepID=A0ABQ9I3X8_9NEOP|nr:hypothetical protein PR048_010872 [Dryococelus australis]